jgi:hypothetical protein
MFDSKATVEPPAVMSVSDDKDHRLSNGLMHGVTREMTDTLLIQAGPIL